MLQKNHDSLMTHEEVEEILRKATNKAVIEIQKKNEQEKTEFVEAEIERLRNQIKHDLGQSWGKDAEMLPDEMLRQMAEDKWKIEQS